MVNYNIIFKNQTKSLCYISKTKKISKINIKSILVKNNLINSDQDFYINDKNTDYIRLENNKILNIKTSDSLIKKKVNININLSTSKKKKLGSVFLFMTLISIPIVLIIFFHSPVINEITTWFIGICGFIFFLITTLNQDSNTYYEEINSQLIKNNNLKSMFIANMSHELKTPITNIFGLTKIIQDDIGNNPNLVSIAHMCERLLHIVNNILLFSQSTYDKVKIFENKFNLDELLNEIYDTLKIKFQERNLSFEITNEFKNEYQLLGDVDKISRIIINLLTNAIKFSFEDNRIELNIKFTDHIDQNKIKLMFEVIDYGIGIEEENLPKIFIPFYQTDSSSTRKFGGTGLGLAISSQLINLMQGSLQVSSRINEYTKFSFYIILNCHEYEETKETEEIEEKECEPTIIEINQDSVKEEIQKMKNFNVQIDLKNKLFTQLINLMLLEFKNLNIVKENPDLIITDMDEMEGKNILIIQLPLKKQIFFKQLFEKLISI